MIRAMWLRAGLQRIFIARLFEGDDGHVMHRTSQQHIVLHDLGIKDTGVGRVQVGCRSCWVAEPAC